MGSEMCIRDRSITDSLSKVILPALREEVAEEVVVEGSIKVAGEEDLEEPVVPVVMNYDEEDKDDGDKATEQARQIKVEFIPNDIRFWFSELEDEMSMAGINKQWLKRSVLKRNLPVIQKEDVKELLTLQQTEAGAHIYLTIKKELLRPVSYTHLTLPTKRIV